MKEEKVDLYRDAGIAAAGKGEYHRALDWYDRALAMVPGDPGTLNTSRLPSSTWDNTKKRSVVLERQRK